MVENLNFQIKLLLTEIDNLKCCANCIKRNKICKYYPPGLLAQNKYCIDWKCDNFTQNERSINNELCN